MQWLAELMCWLNDNGISIIVGAIGSAIGGFVVYRYVMHQENKKDKQENIKKRSTELLNTQMTISLQMDEMKGIEKLCLSITNYQLYGKTLEDHFQNIDGVSAKVTKLKELIQLNENRLDRNLLSLTYHLMVTPPPNVIMALPQEIFNLPKMKAEDEKLNVCNLAKYSKDIATCNRRYMQIISCITHQNEIRNMKMNQFILNIGDDLLLLEVIAANFNLAFKLKKSIENYFVKAESTFIKTDGYIQSLGACPIQAARDKDGKIIFDEFN